MMRGMLCSLFIMAMVVSPALSRDSQAAAATSPPAATSTTRQKMPERLVFFALKPGTSVYATNVGLSQLVNRYAKLKTIVQPYASSKVRFENLRKGTVDLATATASHAYAYTYGLAIPFEPDNKPPYPKARLLLSGNNLYFGWFTRPDTAIKTIPDLRGKKVSGDIPGQYTNQVLYADSLRAFGLDPAKDVQHMPYESTNAVTEAVRDLKLEATFTSLGGAKMEELAAVRGVVVLPFPPEKKQYLRSEPELISVLTLPAGYLSGLREPTSVIGSPNVFICRDDLPDEAAYVIVKAVLEHAQELISVSVEFKEWGKERAVRPDFFMPYHPGAIKYFKEQGLWKPALEARQKEMLERVAKLPKG